MGEQRPADGERWIEEAEKREICKVSSRFRRQSRRSTFVSVPSLVHSRSAVTLAALIEATRPYTCSQIRLRHRIVGSPNHHHRTINPSNFILLIPTHHQHHQPLLSNTHQKNTTDTKMDGPPPEIMAQFREWESKLKGKKVTTEEVRWPVYPYAKRKLTMSR